ncbi:MAG: LysR family transcriptional regulator [Pseudomonadota bacterium]
MENSDIFRLDGQTLRIFLSLCETSSVTKTADHYGLNQSTVSYALDKLRAAIGDPLFVRSGRGVTPTEKALALQPRIQELIAGLEGLVASENYNPKKDSRTFNIAISSPALLPEMKQVQQILHRESAHTALNILRLAPRERLTELLESGDADAAIAVAGLSYRMELNHCTYGHDDLVVYYDPACRKPINTRTEYANARHAVTGFGGNTPSVVERALATLSLSRQIALAAPTASSLRELIPGTELIATMPRALSRGSFSNLAFCEPPIQLPPIRYDLVWHRRFDHSGRNQWLRKVVSDARKSVERAELMSA